MQPEPIEQFVDTLIEQAQLADLPDEFLFSYRRQLMNEAVRRVGLMCMVELSDEHQTEFVAFFEELDQPNETALQQFLQTRIPEFENKMRAAMEEFANEFIAASKPPTI